MIFVNNLNEANNCLVKRFPNIRRQYPTRPNLVALVSQKPRVPFPPNCNDKYWRYGSNGEDTDVHFEMTKSCLLMFLLSATLGFYTTSHIPLVPNFAGAIAYGVVSFSLMTSATKMGDCTRIAGQRLSSLLNVATNLERDVFLIRKASTVSGVVVGRIMVFDRKHRIRDGVGTLMDGIWRKVAGGEEEGGGGDKRGGGYGDGYFDRMRR